MPKKLKKQKILFKLSLGKKKIAVTKPRLEWAILAVLILSVIAVQVSGLYPYAYNYAKCAGEPIEVRGPYFRLPFDDRYGIHMGSDYSRCFDQMPVDVQRDPATRIGAAQLETAHDQEDFTSGIDGYTVYVPHGYSISGLGKSQVPENRETSYLVSANGIEFRAREMKKDSYMSYTNLCDRPPEEKWSGEVIGVDTEGRNICRTHSYYVKDYIVGVNIGNTGIMLQAPLDKSEAELNAAATALYSSMKPYAE